MYTESEIWNISKYVSRFDDFIPWFDCSGLPWHYTTSTAKKSDHDT